MKGDYRLKQDVPRQMKDSPGTKTLHSIADILKKVLEVLSLSGVAGWLFGYAMSALWGMINGL